MSTLLSLNQTAKVKRGFAYSALMISLVIICSSSNYAFAEDHSTQAVNSQDQKDKSPADNREWVKNATKKYSPASWDLLMQYENLPTELEGFRTGGWIVKIMKSMATFDNLKETNNRTEMLSNMAVNIPCVALALQRFQVYRYTRENNLMMDWDRAEAFFYFPPAGPFYVSFPIKSLFPAGELAEGIPDNLRTSLFNIYIKEKKATQRFGVIGLLEEFHAHYFGSRFYLDILEVYKTEKGSDADGFLEWILHSQTSMNAFYEFDFFIMEYLLYMKKHHTADYEALKSYRPFVEAYGTIRSSFEDLINQYQNLIKTEMQRLNASGNTEVGLEGNLLWVRVANSNNRKGTRLFTERNKLMPAISSDRYLTIMSDFPKTRIQE
jgi:hypothetical protein